MKKDGSLEVLNKEPFEIGKKISTKAVGAYRRKDLTDDYKYPIGKSYTTWNTLMNTGYNK